MRDSTSRDHKIKHKNEELQVARKGEGEAIENTGRVRTVRIPGECKTLENNQ